MEIPGNALDSLVNAVTPQDAKSLMVLKTALDSQTQMAMSLLNALPQPSQPSQAGLPEHLGRTINTTA